ncbi:MGH1-like glycoside hydrolase domain-containing protein [Gallaecimonas mangrovi]|uniref:MGH1-like glycoside hydrolase domain-containing protein n=1 Tax=Gallaecimonas mangrovi TaxID=2291597 RepID=UPI000E209111|nr:amylo-alpha-1,6-glucosidase [Gallaecimonas mangrovi]
MNIKPLSLLAAATLWGAAISANATPVLNESAIAQQQFGQDAPWYEHNIPFFEASNPLLVNIYYYRWKLFRAHQRDLGAKGYISTEFLDDVGWQREPYASLNDATGFHILEGRWLRNRRYTDDYIRYMYQSGGNDRHFSEAIADASYQRYLVDGNKAFILKQLPAMEKIYRQWQDHFDAKQGLYWVEPIADATEYTISSIDASGGKDGFFKGFAFRPTINSYMVANAEAISHLAALAGNKNTAARYQHTASTLKNQLINRLWDPKLGHFADRYKEDNQFVHYGDFIRGPELAGFVPWTYNLVPDTPKYAAAWQRLLSASGFAGRFGLRTVTPDYQYYMKQYRYFAPTGAPECQWNGPVWPYQTTQVLTAMANVLENDHQQQVTKADYMQLLNQYAALHMMNNQPDLQEDYDPDNGKVIVGLDRSHHYFHSGFNDLIISGLVGVRPSGTNRLTVSPLVPTDGPEALRYFALQSLPYHGHLLSVVYDRDGKHYGSKGLRVYVDGKKAAERQTLGPLTLTINQAKLAAYSAPIDQLVQLDKKGYPKLSASQNTDINALHQAVDGRVWFFPELANGWDAKAEGEKPAWYQLDFAKPRHLSGTELSFFAADKGYSAPNAYRVEAWIGGKWQTLAEHQAPVAGGINHDHFQAVTTQKLRLQFRLAPQKTMRLVEIKAFD